MSAKPVVFMPYGPVDWHATATESYRILAEANRFFLHDGEVVRIVEDPFAGGSIKKLTPAEAVSTFDRHIRLVKNGDTATSLRKEDASILLAAEAKTQLPLLKGISKFPILRLAGEELIPTPRGYDPVTKMFYLSEPPPDVPFCEAASRIMDDLLGGFAFESPADQGRALANLLLPALKQGGLIAGRVPITVIEADRRGAGKGFLDDVRTACYGTKPSIVTGAVGGVGSADEAFGQALSRGEPFPQLDNLRGTYASILLEQFATGDGLFDIRLVRAGYKYVDREKYFLSITSNGFEATQDLADRCMFIVLRHRGAARFQQYPEGDILHHVRANQPYYLGCIFSAIREWHSCNHPRTSERRFRNGFHDGVQVADWIAQALFGLPPIMDGNRQIQERIASKNLGWLRRLCLEVRMAGRLGEEMRASGLGSVIMNVNMDVPGVPASRRDDEQRVYKAIGSVMSEVFNRSTDNRVEIEGFTVRRETRRHSAGSFASGTDECKFYTISETCMAAAAAGPGGGVRGVENVEITPPSCGT